jgi:hypothetical protein
VEYLDVYPGVDIVYYTDSSRRLEYDMVVHPGAEPSQIGVRFEGAEAVEGDANGGVRLRTADGEWRHSRPAVYQVRSGARHKLAGVAVLRGSGEVGFDVGDFDRSLPLVIDPVLAYSTYLGGTATDSATAIALDAAGNAYVAGWTVSLDFPETAGSRLGNASGVDVFVAKLSPAGDLLYLTYLGGSGEDEAYGIAVDSLGSAVVAGRTYSTDFAIANASQSRPGGGREGFVAKLNPAGSALVFSTYLGGSGADAVNAVAVDPLGNIYVAGDTTSTNFPVLNGFQTQLGGQGDAFVAKFSGTGAKYYGTYLGGRGSDSATAIAVDALGNAYITGSTYSPDFPVLNAFQPRLKGGQDAFATKIGPGGNALIYSTYLGGSGGISGAPESGNGIAVDSAGCAYIAGTTSSADFPTLNPLQSSLSGSQDAFALKLSAAGNALVYGTYLGGSSLDMATAIAVDGHGAASVVGYTASTNFPVANAVQSSNAGGYDAFVATLNAAGNALTLSTYFGGIGLDSANGIAVDSVGNLYVVGQTQSPDFTVLNAIQPFAASLASGFVVRFGNAAIQPPAAVSVSPAVGTGLTQTFTFVFSDPNGAAVLAQEYILFSQAGEANACMAVLNASALHLLSDSGASWLGPITLGSSASLQNSQCSISGASSSVTTSGNFLTLGLAITFNSAFSGAKTVYMEAFDTAGLNSGMQAHGTWTVGVNPQPVAVSVSPSSGTGSTQAFTLVASDPAGYASLSSLYLLVGSTASLTNSCQAAYFRLTNSLYLANDNISGYAGPISVGGSGSISNSQCSISAASAAVATSGQSLTLTVTLTFQSSYNGAKNVYLFAADTGGRVTGWVQLGAWTVPGSPSSVPSIVVPSPLMSGTGTTATLQLTATDPAGYASLSSLYLLVGSTASMTNSCQVAYFRSSNSLYLANDNISGYAGPVTAGGSGSISNSQCSIGASSAAVAASGQSLTLTVTLTFLSGYGGTKNVYLFAVDNGGQVTGWVQLGTWTVPGSGNPVPSVVVPSPLISGTGTAATLQFTASDSAGYASLSNLYLLVGSTASLTNSCQAVLFRSANTLYLVNDNISGYTGPVTVGGSGSISNSQCSIGASSAAVAASGQSLTLTVTLTFLPGYTGAKTVYLFAVDNGGQITGWVQLGTWTVPRSSNPVPSVVIQSPLISGTGTAATLQLTATDSAGYASLSSLYLLVGSTASLTNSCQVAYFRSTGSLYLANDDISGFTGPVSIGGSGSISNSQCSASASSAAVTASGQSLTLTVTLTFLSGYTGTKNVYLFAVDNGGQVTGWVQLGTWTVPPPH